MLLRRLFILAGLQAMFCVTPPASAVPLELQSGMPETSLEPFLYVYEDQQIRFDLRETATRLRDQDITSLGFQPVSSEWGYGAESGSLRWMHFALQNNSEDMAYDLLVLYTAHFQSLTLYIVSETGEIREIRGDSQVSGEDRFLDTRFTIYPIQVRSGKTVNYFLSTRTDQDLMIPMAISGYWEFFEKELFVQSINWLLFGACLGLLIYNFCISFFAREVVFLLNGMAMLTGMVVLGWGDGNLFQIWDASLLHTVYLIVPVVFAGTLIQQQFLRIYLETPGKHPALDDLLKATMPVALVGLAAIPFIAATHILLLSAAVYGVILVIDIGISLYIAIGGSRDARIYVAALLCASILWTCGLFLPESDGFNRVLLMHLFTKLGLVTQISILSLGMGLRIYRIRQQAEDSSRSFERVAQENEDLSRQNTRLEKASHTDGLTQVGNRAFFEATFNSEWSRARRERSNLALLLIHVDHFKSVADTRGHLFGDQCLVAISLAIRGCLRRGSDRLMRFSGEEFVALMAGTDAEGLPIVAERMRLAIKSLEFEDLTLTVSIGGASVVPSAGQKSGDFIELVDKALFAAKDQGRDCTVVRTSGSGLRPASQRKSA